MRIRLLGRFDVLDGGTPMPLGGPRQRAVLAVLAIHANEIVSMDRLADEVWAGNPPATAVVTTQRYVSHLRRALEATPAVIETQRPGYVLRVDDELIDARRFERMVEEGRRLLFDGRPDDAAAVLRQALDLWEGDPLADFAYESFARIETTRLEELRNTALELRIDADLEAGRHRDLVPELEALVASDPLRESWRGQLMRALHGSGRRVDALRVYTDGRRVLAEEVGLDPSPRLQRLEADILDPAGEEPARQKPTGEPARPAGPAGNLPADLTTFVGRADEVAHVTDLVSSSRLVTLTGAGGSGKTRLAVKAAAQAAPAFEGGVWLVELGGVQELDVVPRAVAQSLGVREEADRPVADVVVEALRAQSALVVLDCCEHLLDAVSPLVQRLLTQTDVRVLATSREVLDVPGETVFRVPTLALDDAVRLFVDRARTADPSFTTEPGDDAVLAGVCARLDGLPLALELAAARLDVLTLAQLADRLEDRFEVLTGGTRTAPPRHRTLRATIAWSYDLLSPAERLLLDRLSVFAGSFTVDTAELLAGVEGLERPEVFDHLSRLVRKSLVVRVPSDRPVARYRLLDTVRDFARERLAEHGAVERFERRHADVFAQLAEQAAPRLSGASWDVLEEMEAEHDEFRAALTRLLDARDAEAACRLAGSLAAFWRDKYHMQEGRLWLERAEAAAREQALPPSSALAWAYTWLGFFALDRDDFAQSIASLEEALRLVEIVGDVAAESYALRVRAELARYANDPDLVESLCLRALRLPVDDGWARGDAYRLLALTAIDRGDVDATAAAAEQCLQAFAACGNPERRAGAQLLWASALRDKGRLSEAVPFVEDALGRFQQINEPIGIGMSFWHLSTLVRLQGDYVAAARYAEEAVRTHEGELEFPRGRGRSYAALAEAELNAGNLERAEAACAAATAILSGRGFLVDLAHARMTAARISLFRGDTAEAARICDDALDGARAHGFGRDVGRLLCLRAEISLAQGDPAAAEVAAAEALDRFSQAGDVPGQAAARLMTAEVAAAAGRPADVCAHLDAVCALLADTGAELTHAQSQQYERLRDAAGLQIV